MVGARGKLQHKQAAKEIVGLAGEQQHNCSDPDMAQLRVHVRVSGEREDTRLSLEF